MSTPNHANYETSTPGQPLAPVQPSAMPHDIATTPRYPHPVWPNPLDRPHNGMAIAPIYEGPDAYQAIQDRHANISGGDRSKLSRTPEAEVPLSLQALAALEGVSIVYRNANGEERIIEPHQLVKSHGGQRSVHYGDLYTFGPVRLRVHATGEVIPPSQYPEIKERERIVADIRELGVARNAFVRIASDAGEPTLLRADRVSQQSAASIVKAMKTPGDAVIMLVDGRSMPLSDAISSLRDYRTRLAAQDPAALEWSAAHFTLERVKRLGEVRVQGMDEKGRITFKRADNVTPVDIIWMQRHGAVRAYNPAEQGTQCDLAYLLELKQYSWSYLDAIRRLDDIRVRIAYRAGTPAKRSSLAKTADTVSEDDLLTMFTQPQQIVYATNGKEYLLREVLRRSNEVREVARQFRTIGNGAVVRETVGTQTSREESRMLASAASMGSVLPFVMADRTLLQLEVEYRYGHGVAAKRETAREALLAANERANARRGQNRLTLIADIRELTKLEAVTVFVETDRTENGSPIWTATQKITDVDQLKNLPNINRPRVLLRQSRERKYGNWSARVMDMQAALSRAQIPAQTPTLRAPSPTASDERII